MKKQGEKIKVLMVAIECAPFIKVGGLADVVGSLPHALDTQGVEVRVVLPLFGRVDRKKFGLEKIYSGLEVPSGNTFRKINVYAACFPKTDIKVYFIESEEMFGSRRVYKMHGQDEDRFLFFSQAALYALPVYDFSPQIIHCHDSHTGLIPDLVKVSPLDYIRNLKTLFTIHNFEYQGIAEPTVLHTGNLHVDSLKSLHQDAQDGDVNFMVQGVLNADLINTVSDSYAQEITSSMFGAGLERVIRKRQDDLSGIVNGIDINKFDPQNDRDIPFQYSILTLDEKKRNKLALQKELGLPQDASVPLASMITRLVWQKGTELITEDFMKLGCQFVFLGAGAEKYEKRLLMLQEKFPEFVRVVIGFDAALAQKIYAASDMFLMPSRYEPCGLGQMIAMRYGTVPVVRQTGGLKDTVDRRVGFLFKDFSSQAFYDCLENAVDAYLHMPKTWRHLQERGMQRDFSWEKSAREYIELYQKLNLS